MTGAILSRVKQAAHAATVAGAALVLAGQWRCIRPTSAGGQAQDATAAAA